jgi:oligopeptide transport system substrate-binding protein
MNKLFVVISLLVALSMMLSACGSTSVVTEEAPAAAAESAATDAATEVPAPAKTPTLRIALVTFPDNLDPQMISFVGEAGILRLVYESLTRLNAKGETVPAAAEKWEYNKDATQLTFTLRDGLTYSDGSPLNAARFEYAIRRNIDPLTAGEYAGATDDIIGAVEWRSCTENCDPLRDALYENVKASHADGADCTGYDDTACNTLTLKFKQPAPFFHTLICLQMGFPAKQELIEAGGEAWYLDPANQIGNGPFIMAALEQGVGIELAPNPDYWGQVPAYNLSVTYNTDSAVTFEAFRNNEFDIVPLAPEDLATVENDPTLNPEKNIYAGACTYGVIFHHLKPPFNDPEVRKAFTYALDREAWVKDIQKGIGLPTLTWIPPGWPGYKEGETRLAYDPEKAVQTLTDAGYKVEGGKLIGKDGKEIEITQTFSDTPRNRTQFEWLVARYKEVLGIDIGLNPVEPTTYTALTKDVETAPQMFMLGWCGDYPDPQNWLSVYWRTGGQAAKYGYSNPEMDRLTSLADKELDPAKRMDLYAQAQELLVSNADVAFLYNKVNAFMVKPWVKDFDLSAFDLLYAGDTTPFTLTLENPE